MSKPKPKPIAKPGMIVEYQGGAAWMRGAIGVIDNTLHVRWLWVPGDFNSAIEWQPPNGSFDKGVLRVLKA